MQKAISGSRDTVSANNRLKRKDLTKNPASGSNIKSLTLFPGSSLNVNLYELVPIKSCLSIDN